MACRRHKKRSNIADTTPSLPLPPSDAHAVTIVQPALLPAHLQAEAEKERLEALAEDQTDESVVAIDNALVSFFTGSQTEMEDAQREDPSLSWSDTDFMFAADYTDDDLTKLLALSAPSDEVMPGLVQGAEEEQLDLDDYLAEKGVVLDY